MKIDKTLFELVSYLMLHVTNVRKSWHLLKSLNHFLIMHRKWLLLTILYLLKVMYLYILTLATWRGRLKAIAVFLGKEEPYHQIGEPLLLS